MNHLDHVRSYYTALNSGDADLVASHFTDDAVHYYTRLGPHEGAERIGQNASMGVGMIDGQWFIEHGIVFPPVDSIRNIQADEYAAFFSDCWMTRFKQYDASYLLPAGAIEDEVRRVIRELLSDSAAQPAHA